MIKEAKINYDYVRMRINANEYQCMTYFDVCVTLGSLLPSPDVFSEDESLLF